MSVTRDPSEPPMLFRAGERELREFLSGIQQPEKRAEYVARLLPGCLGLSARDANRALLLASHVLGIRAERMRRYWSLWTSGAAAQATAMIGEISNGQHGFVYYAVSVADPEVLKIGHSREPYSRVARLSSFLGMPMRLIGTRAGTMLDEFEEQCALREDRIAGELFRLPTEDMAAWCALNRKPTAGFA